MSNILKFIRPASKADENKQRARFIMEAALDDIELAYANLLEAILTASDFDEDLLVDPHMLLGSLGAAYVAVDMDPMGSHVYQSLKELCDTIEIMEEYDDEY